MHIHPYPRPRCHSDPERSEEEESPYFVRGAIPYTIGKKALVALALVATSIISAHAQTPRGPRVLPPGPMADGGKVTLTSPALSVEVLKYSGTVAQLTPTADSTSLHRTAWSLGYSGRRQLVSVDFDPGKGTVRLHLAAASASVPTARMRLIQTSAKPGAHSWTVALKTTVDAGAGVIPLSAGETTVTLKGTDLSVP